MKFTQIPSDTFSHLQMNAGILVKSFNPATGVIGDLIGATTGGVQFQDSIEYTDFGEDIDNCPKNMMELKRLDSHEVTMGGTFITVKPETAKMLMGAADVDSSDDTHIVPRNDILTTDFQTLWWIGDYSDVNTGDNAGFIAIKLFNALNTDGFQIQSSDKEKGQFAFTYTGHYSMAAQDTVPYEVYIKGNDSEPPAAPKLTSLSIGNLALDPAFNPGTTSYTTTTTNASNVINATVTGGEAEIKANGSPVSNGSSATWNDGSNSVTVKVGTTTYTVTVTKNTE